MNAEVCQYWAREKFLYFSCRATTLLSLCPPVEDEEVRTGSLTQRKTFKWRSEIGSKIRTLILLFFQREKGFFWKIVGKKSTSFLNGHWFFWIWCHCLSDLSCQSRFLWKEWNLLEVGDAEKVVRHGFESINAVREDTLVRSDLHVWAKKVVWGQSCGSVRHSG